MKRGRVGVTSRNTLNYLGELPVFTKHPSGFSERPDFVDSLTDYDISSKYQSPSYSDIVNLRVFNRYDGVSVGNFDPNLLSRATALVLKRFSPFMRAGLATHSDVVAEMELGASPGYPYKLNFATKKNLFESLGFSWLEGAFEEFLDNPWQGVFFHFLKEEVRKVGKDPHGILAGPVDLQYVAMRIFLHQNHQLYDSHLQHWSAIGMSRDHLDWHRLYLRLKRFDFGGTSDITEMDAHALKRVLEMVCEIRCMLYTGPDADRIRRAIRSLYSGFIDTVCLVNGHVFQKQAGLPTGYFCTSADNTLCMAIYLTYAFLTLHPDWTNEQIDAAVQAVLYGDDNDYTHSPDHPELRPEVVFPIVADAFQLEVKSSGTKPVEEFDFLSAYFKPIAVGGSKIMVPLFNPVRMAAHIQWGPRGVTPYEEFQRIASIRACVIWDDKLNDLLEEWLLEHRSWVSNEEFEAWVPPRDILRLTYLIPRHEPIVVQAKGALNGPALLKEMSRGSYSKNILTKLEDAGVISDAGKNWLIMSLDPFPDQEHPVVGMPDGSAGRSFVQQFNQTLTVGPPPGLAANATWDCHIALLPELVDPSYNTASGAPGVPETGCMVSENVGQLNIGASTAATAFPWRAPLCVVTMPTGNATFPINNVNPLLAGGAVTGFDMTGYIGPQTRIIGGGFEVVNTTAELYKSGSVIYYTQPSEIVRNDAWYSDTSDNTNQNYCASTIVTRLPPANPAQAMSIPGSDKRAAEEGAYIPFRFSKGRENPPVDPQQMRRAFFPTSPFASGQPAWGVGASVAYATVGSGGKVPLIAYHQPIPFDSSGAYFSGLNANSSLDVTLRLFIEGFPTPSANQALVSLAVPCPPMDERACEIYSKVCAQLPPGVPVSQNADGTWWRDLLKTVSSIAPTIGSALGSVVPGAGLIGSGVGKAAELLAGMKLGEKAQKQVDKRRAEVDSRVAKAMASPNGPKSKPKPRKKAKAKAKAKAADQGAQAG